MTDIVVRPVRFTDDLPAMRRFLETLGLRTRIESERGGWADLVAGAGMVALHSAADSAVGAGPGETRLSFEADDAMLLAEQLESVGVFGVRVHDEAYGQVLTCVDPLGDLLMVDGRSRDLYGYRLHRARADSRLRVMPVRFTSPVGEYAAFLDQFGFTRTGGDELYAIHAGDGDAGQVGLHHVYEGELPIVPSPGAVHLTFETTEPLDEVAARLVAAGYADATVVREDFGSMLGVTDPDGRECQVHEPL